MKTLLQRFKRRLQPALLTMGAAVMVLSGCILFVALPGILWAEAAMVFRAEKIPSHAHAKRLSHIVTGEDVITVQEFEVDLDGKKVWMPGSATPGQPCVLQVDRATGHQRVLPIADPGDWYWPSVSQLLGLLVFGIAFLAVLKYQAWEVRGVLAWHWSKYKDGLGECRRTLEAAPQAKHAALAYGVHVTARTVQMLAHGMLVLAVTLLWLGVCWAMFHFLAFKDGDNDFVRGLEVILLLGLACVNLSRIGLWIERDGGRHPVIAPLLLALKELFFLLVVGRAVIVLFARITASKGAVLHFNATTDDTLVSALWEILKEVVGL